MEHQKLWLFLSVVSSLSPFLLNLVLAVVRQIHQSMEAVHSRSPSERGGEMVDDALILIMVRIKQDLDSLIGIGQAPLDVLLRPRVISRRVQDES